MHPATVADIAAASDPADAHAACGPDANRPAAARAARSAAACARCRAITAEPTSAPPTVNAINTAIIIAATTLAAPQSEARLDRRDRLGRNRDAGQQDRLRADPRHHVSAVSVKCQPSIRRSAPAHHVGGSTLVTTGGQPGGLARGVHAPHLHSHGREAADTERQDDHQRGDREGRLDGGTTRIVT